MMQTLRLQAYSWIYCPGHALVRGYELADPLIRKGFTQDVLRLDKLDIAKAFMDTFCGVEKPKWENNPNIRRIKERG